MAVKYILTQAGFKMGLDPSDLTQRSVLLRFLNEAGNELYDQNDADGVLREQLFQVSGDQQIALPAYVGPLRAMREYTTHVPWHLYNMRPRYNQFNWQDRWRSWRMKGTSALVQDIENESVVKVIVPTVENPPIVVTVSGTTPLASGGMSENITMDATNKQGTIQFVEIKHLKKDRVNTCDVRIEDIDGRELATIPNNVLQMRYRLVDVSLYPWSNTATNNADHYMEVLYKEALPWMQNDEDEYPVEGLDNIIVNKMIQLWMEEQGDMDKAVAFDNKASRSLARKQEDANRGAEQVAALCENPHDSLLPRNRPMGPSRYTGQIYY